MKRYATRRPRGVLRARKSLTLAAAAAASLMASSALGLDYDDGGVHVISDASLIDEVITVSNASTLRIEDGAVIEGRIEVHDTSSLIVSGGHFGGATATADFLPPGLVRLYGDSIAQIAGGTFGGAYQNSGSIWVMERSRLTIADGVFGASGSNSGVVYPTGESTVEIGGGAFGGTGSLSGTINGLGTSRTAVSGGTFGGAGTNSGIITANNAASITVSGATLNTRTDGSVQFQAFTAECRITLVGCAFTIYGEEAPAGAIDRLGLFRLDGTFADGTAFQSLASSSVANTIWLEVDSCGPDDDCGDAAFSGLGFLPGGGLSFPWAISADGSVAVGYSDSSSGREAFQWSEAGGIESIGDLAGGIVSAAATAVSAGGDVIVGQGVSAQGVEAFAWDSANQMTGLGDLPGSSFQSFAWGVSADGSTIVGSGTSSLGVEAFVWTPGGGMQGIGDLPGGSFASRALGISGDGSIVVGSGRSSSGEEAFVWSSQGGMLGLGDLPGGTFRSQASAVSDDGAVVVGVASSPGGSEAFRWTAAGGMEGLGELPGGAFFSEARDASGNGTLVVGRSISNLGEEAVVWDELGGIRKFQDVLENDHGLDLGGWRLLDAVGISEDGRTLVGAGLNPSGQREAWIARLPCPNTPPVVTCPTPPPSFECDSGSTPDGSPGLRTTLSAVAHDADGDAMTVVWEVDGVAVQTTTDVPPGTSVLLDAVFPMGSSTVTVTADDGSAADTCSTTVTVIDTTDPTAVCQHGVVVPADAGACIATGVYLPEPEVSDNCQIAALTNDAPSEFPIGETIVTWTVTDASGNSATCEQIVTVEDREPPFLVCPPDVVVGHDLDSAMATGVVLGEASQVSDNCPGVVVVSNTAPSPANFPLGETEVTWIATDAAGNTFACTQKVTVTNEAPTIDCPAPVQAECSDGTPGAFVELRAPIDDADHTSLSVIWAHTSGQVLTSYSTTRGTNAPFSAHFPPGTTTIVLTVDDGIEAVHCTIPVTVLDLTAPVVLCLPAVEVGTDPGECFASGVDLGTPVVSDNCGPVTLTNDGPAAMVFPLGETVVTWTATDAAGNTATCGQKVTVLDDEPPHLTCPDDIVVAHDPDACVATNVALGEALASDNCGIVALTHNAPAEFVLGETIVTWTATDAAGNTTTCDQSVVVTNAAPVADAGENIIVECESASGATVTLNGSGSSDPEGDTLAFLWSADGVAFDDASSATPTATFPLGSTRVTVTVTDRCGEVASANVLVVVQDLVAPVIQITDASHDMLWPPNHAVVPVTLRIFVTDNCEAPGNLDVVCTATSDEPDDSTGDGAFTGDVNHGDGHVSPVSVPMAFDAATGFWEGTVHLRAERAGGGDGRKYAVRCTVSDGTNTSAATVCIVVPDNNGSSNRRR